MKKISFLLFATLLALTGVRAQKKEVSPKTVTAASNKKIPDEKSASAKVSKPSSKGEGEKMLNPQPLPPKARKDIKPVKKGDKKMLNPQPLPPKELKDFKPGRKGSEKMLNPQPLPPKASRIKTKN